jgi:hypothetical protein
MTAIQADTLIRYFDAYLTARSSARRPPYPGLEPAGPIEAGWAAREEARARSELTLKLMGLASEPGPGEGPAGVWDGSEGKGGAS